MHKHTGTGCHTDDTRGTGGFTRVGGGRDVGRGGGAIVAGRVGHGS